MDTITAEALAAFTGALISAGFAYIPGLRIKFAALSSEAKSGIMALVLIAVSALITISSCINLWLFIECTKPGIMGFLQILAYALILNQTTYIILPKMADVKRAKFK